MSFFRKLRMHNKHKKLSEEWALATSLKDLSEINETIEEELNVTTFNVKYLGCTPIAAERSQNATAEAIKSVITNSKSTRRKNKGVKLNVSPKGIEMLDRNTDESLLKVSIYKISYCSADAAHDHVFAFIGSSGDDLTKKDEDLSCHVYWCPKRKIAHDVTLTVARCFENAYQTWRKAVEKKMYKEEMKNRKNMKKIEEVERSPKAESIRDLLIDFTPEIQNDVCGKDSRQYLQNTWISFDDDTRPDNNFVCAAAWEQQQLVF